MRLAVTSLVLVGCVPRLYSDDHGQTPTAGCEWEAPQNTWPADAPPACPANQGYEVGQTAPDVRLIDQNGDEVALWQFYGSVILFDVSTIWCGPCQELGAHTEANWQDYKDEGFVYLTVLQQDAEAEPTEPEDVAYWVDQFGITAPVLADPAAITEPALKTGFPAVLLIGRDLKVIQRLGPFDSEIRAAIEANL